MKLRTGCVGSLCVLLTAFTLSAAPSALAQHEAGQVQGPSKYIYLHDVSLKPGQTDAFAKLETDEAQALRAAHAPRHYFGMWSITGPSHVIFIHDFDSFAELQKNHDATVAMTKLEDTLRADAASEAPLIADSHTSIYKYDEDLSLRAPLDLSKMRFMRILLFHVRSGHGEDFEHLIKVYAKAYEALPNAHWAMFEKIYGVGSDNTYLLVTPMAELSYVDDIEGSGKQFAASTGEDQLQILRQQGSADVESSELDLFALGADISYVPESWITSSPDFWGKK